MRGIIQGAVVAAVVLAGGVARAETTVVASGDSLRIDGYTSFEYERQLEKASRGKGDPNGSFDADLFDLVLNWRGSDHLRVAADLTWEHGAATEAGQGNVAIEYAFAEYTLADWARVRAGKMFTPFGIYNEIHTAKPTFLSVKEPLATNKNDKFGSEMRFYPRWGTGVALLGNGHAPGELAWDYVVAVTNGDQTSTNPNEEDDNKWKAVQGRVRVGFRDQLEVGLSGYRDELRETADGLGDGDRTVQLTLGAQASWRSSFGPGIEVEWVRGQVRPSKKSTLPEVVGQGATAMVWWTFLDRYTPYGRVEWLDPSKDVSRDRALLWLGGVNVRVPGGLVLKAEFDKIRAQQNNARFAGGKGNYSEVKLAAVVGF